MFKRSICSLLIVTLTIGWTGCSSTTFIRTNDSAAKIYIDGEFKGRGSVTHTDQKIVGSTTFVKIEKPGCEPQQYTFNRAEEFDAGACLGGLFIWPIFLWIMKYKPEHNFEYSCEPRK